MKKGRDRAEKLLNPAVHVTAARWQCLLSMNTHGGAAARDGERSVPSQRRKTKESTAEFRRSLGEQISYTVGHLVHFLAIA